MSIIRKYHNHKPQTNPWHREEEPHNHHETQGRPTNQSYQLSIPQGLNCKQYSETQIHLDFKKQAYTQAEARKHGLQHHMGLDARNHDCVACEQQRRRTLRPVHPHRLISAFVIRYQKRKVTRSDIILVDFNMNTALKKSNSCPLIYQCPIPSWRLEQRSTVAKW